MKIDSKTKISKLIDSNKKTIDVISSINKHFSKLKNPFLRKALAPRVTIAEAARIGGVPVCVLIDKLKEIGFEIDSDCGCEAASPKDKYRLKEKLVNMRKEKVVEMDVRPTLANGDDPFEAIMSKLKIMNDDETLLIINTFEPIPLLNILKKKGYSYETVRPENGVVHTYLEKADGEIISDDKKRVSFNESSFEEMEKRFEGKMTEVDVRDLEMPMPMVTILNEIEKI